MTSRKRIFFRKRERTPPNQNRDFRRDERSEEAYLRFRLTGNDETSLGGGQPSFAREPVLRATLVSLVTVLGSDVPDVQFPGWQHQVLSIYHPPVKIKRD